MIRSNSFVILDQDSSLSNSEHEDMLESLLNTNEDLCPDPVVVDPEFPSSITSSIEDILKNSETNLISSDASSANQPSNASDDAHSSPAPMTVSGEISKLPASDDEVSTNHQTESLRFLIFSMLRNGIQTTANIFSHLDNSSKMAALIVLVVACLLSATIICLTSKQASSSTFLEKKIAGLEDSLSRCQSALHWRQEKIDQLEMKIVKVQAKATTAKKDLSACRSSIGDYNDKNTKCQEKLDTYSDKISSLEKLNEKSTQQVIELQNQIIKYQTEYGQEDQPFLVKAFDSVFGGHGHCKRGKSCKSKWRD